MKLIWTILTLFSLSIISSQDIVSDIDLDGYSSNWRGKLESLDTFTFDIFLNVSGQKLFLQIRGKQKSIHIPLESKDGIFYYGNYENQLGFRVKPNGSNPIVFLKIGHHLCQLDLKFIKKGIWQAKWDLLLTNAIKANLFLSFNKNNDSTYYASVFFKEPTFHYLFAQNFRIEKNRIYFTDIRSGMNFIGHFRDKKTMTLSVDFLGSRLQIELSPYDSANWKLGEVHHQAKIYTSPNDIEEFYDLTQAIELDTLERTHAVLISKRRKIIYEAYFDGFDKNILHDTRSVAKSFVSALVGTAIKNNVLQSENLQIKPFFDAEYKNIDWSKGKDKITIAHLLTMSSGIDAIDFGLNRTSYANEGNYQSSADWINYIISAPMVNVPGEDGNYGSGSAQLLSRILSEKIEEPLEFYIHENLFYPLGISNYRIQLTNENTPYFGGGWYVTPRDLLKFGQLYLENGKHNDNTILTEHWIEKSFKKHVVLNNTIDKNHYGYLFWHKSYIINGEEIQSIECRGSGGQYVFIVPKLDAVIVITSGNYTNGKGFQPERIMHEYVLPGLLKL